MKSIERRFAKLQEAQPKAGSYINFAQAVEGGQFAPASIRRWFYRLVEKEEYERGDTGELFAHLDQLTNPPRATQIEGTATREGVPVGIAISRAL